jgi:hypothetical protein
MDFREFDLHLTDPGDLEDFLSYYDKPEEAAAGGLYLEAPQQPFSLLKQVPSLGNLSAPSPLQLQPYSASSPEPMDQSNDSRGSSEDTHNEGKLAAGGGGAQPATTAGNSGTSRPSAGAASSRPPPVPRSASGRLSHAAATAAAGTDGLKPEVGSIDALTASLAASLAADHGGSERPSSHSTVEKQRRDRLNSLLEELGDLVPPREAKYAADGAASVRRPKHVVLTDVGGCAAPCCQLRLAPILHALLASTRSLPRTHLEHPPPCLQAINLLHSLQQRLQSEESQLQELRGQVEEMQRERRERTAAAAATSALAPAAGACAAVKDEPGSASGALQDCSAQQMLQSGQPILCSAPPAELPQAPQPGSQAMGVVVERGKASLYVKVCASGVHCGAVLAARRPAPAPQQLTGRRSTPHLVCRSAAVTERAC